MQKLIAECKNNAKASIYPNNNAKINAKLENLHDQIKWQNFARVNLVLQIAKLPIANGRMAKWPILFVRSGLFEFLPLASLHSLRADPIFVNNLLAAHLALLWTFQAAPGASLSAIEMGDRNRNSPHHIKATHNQIKYRIKYRIKWQSKFTKPIAHSTGLVHPNSETNKLQPIRGK